MLITVLGLVATAANEEFVPPGDWRAQVALPVTILLFFGSIFLLLRSNLGTRRAYLVEASAFFGFMLILSLFWAFGAPGTPQNTGPQNLPGQPADHYLPKWIAFAQDSLVADQPEYDVVKDFPQGFSAPPGGVATGEGVDAIQEFFAGEPAGQQVGENWVVDGEPLYARAENGRPILGVKFVAVDDDGNPAPDDGTYTAFGFFDAGFAMFPSLVFIALSLGGLALHLVLLAWDENRERDARREAERADERERVPAPA